MRVGTNHRQAGTRAPEKPLNEGLPLVGGNSIITFPSFGLGCDRITERLNRVPEPLSPFCPGSFSILTGCPQKTPPRKGSLAKAAAFITVSNRGAPPNSYSSSMCVRLRADETEIPARLCGDFSPKNKHLSLQGPFSPGVQLDSAVKTRHPCLVRSTRSRLALAFPTVAIQISIGSI